MEKVFGIGFSKTGTTSLEKALEILGYNVCKGHWKFKHNDYNLALWVNRDIQELIKMTNYWDAFADGPWGGTHLYKFLVETYPSAKYILTLREPESWYNSFEAMFTKFDENLETALESFHQKGCYGTVYFFRNVFNIEKIAGNKKKIIEEYQKHNNQIIDFFKNNKYNFLIYNLTTGEGWEKLCEFLDKPIPKVDFPYANKGAYRERNVIMKERSSLKNRFKGKLISIIKKI